MERWSEKEEAGEEVQEERDQELELPLLECVVCWGSAIDRRL